LLGLLSIGPTRRFPALRGALRDGQTPDLEGAGGIRSILAIELAGVAVILLCAVLAAVGIGAF
jgi:uncharacterized membrane protein